MWLYLIHKTTMQTSLVFIPSARELLSMESWKVEWEDACRRGSRACGLSFTEVERMIIIEKVCLTFVVLQVKEILIIMK